MIRLIKKSIMSQDTFKSTLTQLSNKGREILKLMENYKFSIEQSARLISNDSHLTQFVIQKKKTLDQAMGIVYSIVFDIENINIIKEYSDQEKEKNEK